MTPLDVAYKRHLLTSEQECLMAAAVAMSADKYRSRIYWAFSEGFHFLRCFIKANGYDEKQVEALFKEGTPTG